MPRFVVLEHAHHGVHWDFLLETDGVLRSWALDEPIAPGRSIPARALPDHRMIYLDFEGPISGGRGTVKRVDGGDYQIKVWEADRVVVELWGNQLRGAASVERVGAGAAGGSSAWEFRIGNAD